VVREMKSADGLGIWLCGGGVLAGHLIDEIDELIIKRQPMVLGDGHPMFAGSYQPTAFDLVDRHDVGAVAIERHRRRTA
ncbi:MAG: dihydrofolate reductase, partial [Actinomycetota bacterium]